MTWIVAKDTPFGYAIGLSDVCVSFGGGTQKDCLQKIYPVGRFIAARFAGSVAIGFDLIRRLSELLYTSDPGCVWNPQEVANWWQRDAQDVFNRFPDQEKRKGAQMMLLAAHPTENMGDVGWPKTCVYKFSWPEFTPIQIPLDEIGSIGSGSVVPEYKKALEGLALNERVEQLEAARPGGMARGLVHSITRRIEDSPTQGISRHLHICLVTRGSIEVGTNDRRQIGGDSSNDLIMPPVATSNSEFARIASEAGLQVKGATAQLFV